MEKKTIIIAASATAVVVATGALVAWKILGNNNNKLEGSKTLVTIDDDTSIDKLVRELGQKYNIDMDDTQVFGIKCGIVMWARNNKKSDLDANEFVNAAQWAADNMGLSIKFN